MLFIGPGRGSGGRSVVLSLPDLTPLNCNIPVFPGLSSIMVMWENLLVMVFCCVVGGLAVATLPPATSLLIVDTKICQD